MINCLSKSEVRGALMSFTSMYTFIFQTTKDRVIK